MAVLTDFIEAGRLAEAGNVCIFPVTITPPVMVGVGDLLDVLVGQFPMGAVGHETHVAGIDEQHFAGAFKEFLARHAASVIPVLRQEPQADGNLGAVEKLARHSHHAVHHIRFDEVLADFTLAAGVGGHGPVRQHETRDAVGCQVMDHVLHPGEVGVAGGWYAVLPAFVIPQQIAAPIGYVEGRVGKDQENEAQYHMLVVIAREAKRVRQAAGAAHHPPHGRRASPSAE